MNFKVYFFANPDSDSEKHQTYHFIEADEKINLISKELKNPPIHRAQPLSLKTVDPQQACFDSLMQMKIEAYTIQQLVG